jgi:hypothetical protein
MQAVAFGKLQGILDSKPLNLPGKNAINLGLLGGVLACGTAYMTTGDPAFAVNMLWATAALGGVLGAHLTASIGESAASYRHCCLMTAHLKVTSRVSGYLYRYCPLVSLLHHTGIAVS